MVFRRLSACVGQLGIEAEGKVLGCYQERGGERQDGHRNALMGIFDSSETILHCEKETIDFGIENRQDHITPGRQPWQQCGKPKRYYSRARNGNFPELARPKTR